MKFNFLPCTMAAIQTQLGGKMLRVCGITFSRFAGGNEKWHVYFGKLSYKKKIVLKDLKIVAKCIGLDELKAFEHIKLFH